MQQSQGLSTMGAQPAPEAEIQAPEGQQGITIEDVIKALMQGATPEQLLQSGVPQEMIQQAIQILQQQSQQNNQGLSQIGMR